LSNVDQAAYHARAADWRPSLCSGSLAADAPPVRRHEVTQS
jgi:hypothetical protein